jgi:NAD(P)-dependent dehydrogenase (short-subunit alcohol dehydrogenase family)
MEGQSGSDPVGRVLLEFQSVMEQFLELETQLIRAYLSASAQATVEAAPAEPAAQPAAFAPIPASVAQAHRSTAPLERAVEPQAKEAAASGVRATVRLAPYIVERPSTGPMAGLAPDHCIVITDDGQGICTRLAALLRAAGYRVAAVSLGEAGDPKHHIFQSMLDSPSEVERLVRQISSACGPIGGLVHLLPLSPVPDFERLDCAGWRRRLAIETRSLFLLTQAAYPMLDKAAASGGAIVLAATALGGTLGTFTGRSRSQVFPGQGGVLGFMKCLALEWPDVRVRAVDLDPSESFERLADSVREEMWLADKDVEVGYIEGRRVAFDMMPLPATSSMEFAIPSDSVILATGGARGITADICRELAVRCQPTFVLVGQSPLPAAPESSDTANLTSPAELKRALMERFRAEALRTTPAMVEKAHQQLLKEREIRENLGALVAAGARVHYVALDVRDDEAFGALIDDVYATYGRLDGVVHGAGIIEDKLVRDKAVESFDRVLDTKTSSAFVLSRKLKPEQLRFAVFFSSVAGRFGNRGQSDYAAANEIVSKLAAYLSQRWPVRVCAIDWAPWDKRGMVSPELKQEFIRRGVGLIPPADGARAFWEEIQQSRTDAPEVVIAGATGSTISLATPRIESTPLLKGARRESSGGTVKYIRTLDVSTDRYLNDHRLDGKAVLPLAFATEFMAEAAAATWPDLTVVAVKNLQLLKGIAVDDSPVQMVITVRPPVHQNDEGLTEADVELATPALLPPTRYRAVVELATRPATRPTFSPPAGTLSAFPLSRNDAYQRWTFHGPLFQRVTSIDGMSAGRMKGRIHSPAGSCAIAGVARAGWVIDPYVFDAALQLLLMWSRAQNDKTALPSRFRAFRCYGALSDTNLTAHVRVESKADGHALDSDVHFVDEHGQVLAVLHNMEASCTMALNRLATVADDSRAG